MSTDRYPRVKIIDLENGLCRPAYKPPLAGFFIYIVFRFSDARRAINSFAVGTGCAHEWARSLQ